MIKNILILLLLYLYGTLLYENRTNVDILINDIETKARAIESGAEFIKEQFEEDNSDKEFSTGADDTMSFFDEEPVILHKK